MAKTIFFFLLFISKAVFSKPELSGEVNISNTDNGVLFQITITNSGDEDSGFFYSDLWFHLDHSPKPGDPSDKSIEISNIKAGDKFTTEVLWKDPVPGTYTAWLFVDSVFNMVKEEDESNNIIGPISYTVTNKNLPDLKIKKVDVIKNENLITFKVLVQNSGKNDAYPHYSIDIFYNRDDAPGIGDFGDDFVEQTMLPAGTEKWFEFGPHPYANGTYCAWVVVDSQDEIEELNEDNNIFGCIEVKINTDVDLNKPDLLISNITYTENEKSIDFLVTVNNTGVKPASDFKVGLYLNLDNEPLPGMEPDLVTSVSELAENDFTTVYFTWNDLLNGTFKVWAMVDFDSSVTEINEKNNTFGPVDLKIDKKGLDLAITKFDWEFEADKVVYLIKVKNLGTVDVQNFEVDLFYNFPEKPDISNPLLSEAKSDSLSVDTPLKQGEEMDLKMIWDAPEVGTNLSWVFVDFFDNLGDVLKGNNYMGPLEVYIPDNFKSKPDIAVKEFAVKAEGATLNILVTVKNKGGKSTGKFKISVYLKSENEPEIGEPGDLEVNVDNLLPGEEKTWSPKITSEKSNDFLVWVFADSTAAVDESDETNNIQGPLQAKIEISACEIGVRVEKTCICDNIIAQYGEFCCEYGISTIPCKKEFEFVEKIETAEPNDYNGGGCSLLITNNNSPLHYFIHLLVLVLFATVMRKRCKRKKSNV